MASAEAEVAAESPISALAHQRLFPTSESAMHDDGGNVLYCPPRCSGGDATVAAATSHVRLTWAKSGRRGRCATPAVVTAALAAFQPERVAFSDGGGLAFATFDSPAAAAALLCASPLAPRAGEGL